MSNGTSHCAGNTILFTSETISNSRQWMYSPSDFAVVSPSGNIMAAYMKASSESLI